MTNSIQYPMTQRFEKVLDESNKNLVDAIRTAERELNATRIQVTQLKSKLKVAEEERDCLRSERNTLSESLRVTTSQLHLAETQFNALKKREEAEAENRKLSFAELLEKGRFNFEMSKLGENPSAGELYGFLLTGVNKIVPNVKQQAVISVMTQMRHTEGLDPRDIARAFKTSSTELTPLEVVAIIGHTRPIDKCFDAYMGSLEKEEQKAFCDAVNAEKKRIKAMFEVLDKIFFQK